MPAQRAFSAPRGLLGLCGPAWLLGGSYSAHVQYKRRNFVQSSGRSCYRPILWLFAKWECISGGAEFRQRKACIGGLPAVLDPQGKHLTNIELTVPQQPTLHQTNREGWLHKRRKKDTPVLPLNFTAERKEKLSKRKKRWCVLKVNKWRKEQKNNLP